MNKWKRQKLHHIVFFACTIRIQGSERNDLSRVKFLYPSGTFLQANLFIRSPSERAPLPWWPEHSPPPQADRMKACVISICCRNFVERGEEFDMLSVTITCCPNIADCRLNVDKSLGAFYSSLSVYGTRQGPEISGKKRPIWPKKTIRDENKRNTVHRYMCIPTTDVFWCSESKSTTCGAMRSSGTSGSREKNTKQSNRSSRETGCADLSSDPSPILFSVRYCTNAGLWDENTSSLTV